MKRVSLLAIFFLAFACTGPKTTYDWGTHDERFYDLMKDPAKLEAYGQSLRALIESHPDGRRLPPGICAEYGFILLSAGRPNEAEPFFLLEKKYWPESSQLMDRMVTNCRTKSTKQVSL